MSLWLLALLLQTGVIEGYVVREGTNPPTPLVNARLELSWTGDSFVARTDVNGRFAFSNLPAARFRLNVTKDGYIKQGYRAAAMAMPGVNFDLKAGQILKDIVFRMESAPTISGMIRDRQGAPIANILVQALRRTYDTRGNRTLTVAASTKTDDHGDYRLYWLDPGEYFISAERPSITGTTKDSGIAYPPTYFPGFAEPEDAKPVFLDVGRDAGGMDFILSDRPFANLEVYVMSRTRGQPPPATVTLVRPEEGASKVRHQAQAAGGIATVQGVAPGSYLISAVSGDERVTQRIQIRNADLRVRLTISSGLTLNGSVASAEGTPMDLRAVRIDLTEADPALPVPTPVAISSGNRFSISGIQPGTYSVNVSGLPGDAYVKAAAFASADALEKPFVVNFGGFNTPSPDLQLLVGLDGGRVSGVVYDRSDRPTSGAQVVLVPTESRFRFDLYRRAVSGEDGSFALRGIAPGNYKLLAWDSLESNAELNAEYMRPYEGFGTPLRIAPGENPAVPLRLIQIGR